MAENKNILRQIAVERYNFYPGRPSLVLLHDSLGCIALWRDFPRLLGEATHCNVIAYDRPGYGRSGPFVVPVRDKTYLEQEADMLAALLEYWHIERPVLFGHSDGGSIALIAAAKYAPKIAAVITEGAHIFVEDITLSGIRQAVIDYQTTELPLKLARYHGDKTEAMFRAWADTWLSDAFRDWNISSWLPGVICHSLIIQGEGDEYGTIKQVEDIVRLTTGKSMPLIIPGVQHSPHREVPRLIIDKAATFMAELRTGIL